jgi:formamidopyrimidine-DNA glycosylase
VVGRRVRVLRVHEARLRWRVQGDLPRRLQGRRVEDLTRRAKYLLFHFDDGGTLILHLGMSGNLRVMPQNSPRLKHDHLEWLLEDDTVLRFNDPRRFGSVHWLQGDAAAHPLLQRLGPEPLEDEFDADYLWSRLRDRRIAIKPLIMNAQVVVGVGNIYASEALFVAGIRPGRAARRVTREEAARLVQSIKAILGKAVRVGGTTLRDYVGADGNPGYFRQQLQVYARGGEPCRQCGTPVRQRVQAQRSTYWCATCQR